MANSTVWKVQNVDIGRDHQGEAAGQRGALARRCAAREAQQPARRTGGDRPSVCSRVTAKVTPSNRTASAKTPTAATKVTAAARSRGRLRTTTAKPTGGKPTLSTLGDRVLALATGKTQQEIAAACKGARPNHVGGAIARHKRAGRIEEREGKLYATQSARTEQ